MGRTPNRYIYLIRVPKLGKSLYKIGYTKCVNRRIKELSLIYGDINLVGKFKFNQTEHIEDILHKLFEDKQYKDIYFFREIFELTDNDVLSCLLVLKALQMLEVRTGKLASKWLLKNEINFPVDTD